MKTAKELTAFANRSTHERRRAEAMGFVFHDVKVVDDNDSFGYMIEGNFTCVCGTPERFRFVVDPLHLMHSDVAHDLLDPAKELRRFGSFSRKHLLADGYSEARVNEILRRGEEFDRANP